MNYISKRSNGAQEPPRLWISAPVIGRASEPWMGRQIELIRSFERHVLCWQLADEPAWNVSAATTVLPGLPPNRKTRSGAPEGTFSKFGSRIKNSLSGNFYSADAATRRCLRALYQKAPPSVMLAHYGHTGLALNPVAKDLGIPIAVHFHGLDISSMLRNRWYRWSLMRNLEGFDRIIVVGERQYQWMESNGLSSDRLRLIPCGVPVDEFSIRRQGCGGNIRFLAVSRLVPQKGIAVCIDAFAAISNTLPQATLTIVGDGPERDALEQKARSLGLRDKICFSGAMSSAGVKAELAAADIFLQHSLDHEGWYEGFGVSVTEASAMGLPVIVSRCGGLVDQVQHEQTGYVVDQRDVLGMAKAMLEIASDPGLREIMGAAARQNAIRSFDAKRQVEKLERTLHEISR